jgi:hypothetical protein
MTADDRKRADAADAKRVLAYAPWIAYRRHAAPAELANRTIRPSLYSALLLRR